MTPVQAEILNSRAALAAKIRPFVSADWIMENVFDMSVEEIGTLRRAGRSIVDQLVELVKEEEE